MRKKINLLKGMFYACFALFFIQGIKAQEYNCKEIYNTTDVTQGLQKAINAGYKSIVIPYMGPDKIWITQPLTLKSNINISIDPNVVIQAKAMSVVSGQSLFIIKDVNNVVVSGGKGSIIQMPIDEYKEGEWRNVILIRGSTNVTIENLELSKSGGDGIYIGVSDNQDFSEDIKISHVVCSGNARNGISVVSAKKVEVSDCSFINTGIYNSPELAKGGPWAGIDLEPNKEAESMDNILISNCNFISNKRYGILLAFGNLKTTSSPVNISIDKVDVKSCEQGITLIGFKENFGGQIKISNVDLAEVRYSPILFKNWDNNLLKVFLDRITLTSNNEKVPVIIYNEKGTESSPNITKTRVNVIKK